MRYKVPMLLLFAVIQSVFPCIPEIKQIDSFHQADSVFSSANNKTLVLFDVDETLIVPECKLLWNSVLEAHDLWASDLFEKADKRAISLEKSFGLLRSIWLTKENPNLIEPSIVPIIKDMQSRNVRVFALTAVTTGAFAMIPSLAQWRFDKLKALGIDFRRPDIPDITLDQIAGPEPDNIPAYYKGILFSAAQCKGLTVKEFLTKINWRPEKVVMFDNELTRVEQVCQAMKTCSIPCHGYHYKGAQRLDPQLDKQLCEFQLNYLVENNDWLSEVEARALLEQKK